MPSVSVTVLLFASYADAFGRSAVELSLPPGATVRDAVSRLTLEQRDLPLPAAPLVAVNEAYTSYDHVLAAGDEVALIPPVAGG